ncbi:MAG: hypothetical protein ABR992_13615 [Solirubrobacteraceae bacterium]
MRMRLAGVSLLVLSSLAALVGDIADTAGSATRSLSVPRAPIAALPPQLQALELKMQQLHVNSERYTQISRGTVTIVNETNGKPVGREKSVSLDENISGEVSISPPQAEVIDTNTGKPIQIQIGSTEYEYSREIARKHPRRAWIRRKDADSSAFPSYSSPLEVFASPGDASVGGEGSYAQLFNLLTTAVGSVAVLGSVSVDGQATTEFTADVEPLRLIRGLTVEDVRNLEKHPVLTKLTIFLSEAGFPLRVTLSQSAQHAHVTETTDITAVEVPLSISPPPPGETISVARARKLEGPGHKVTVSS